MAGTTPMTVVIPKTPMSGGYRRMRTAWRMRSRTPGTSCPTGSAAGLRQAAAADYRTAWQTV